LFAAEVEARGASVVAREGFDRGVADFRDIIQRMRQAGPEAMFLPVAPSEIRLIAPQLTFHDLETQLFGPSSWNNSLLEGEVADYLDRAIFPSDIALIPEGERARFEELWERRFRQSSVNPFALKTYYAVRQILTAISGGARTRDDLLTAMQQALSFEGEGGRRLGMEKLRVLDEGKIEPFPVGVFPEVVEEPSPSGLFDLFGGD
jgi:ABC-type branched-subunit amino acid transport system substrate-binding protein